MEQHFKVLMPFLFDIVDSVYVCICVYYIKKHSYGLL